jgi:hypothetical protein
MNYNLLDEQWIPVLYHNGRTERIGILRHDGRPGALEDADRIRQIASSNPMDQVALLRFLLAVLMWCKEDAKSSLTALYEKSRPIPEDWLTKLKESVAAFNLLGDGDRFYQDASVKSKETRPIADLLAEFPGADSVNHMRHIVHDGSYGFCPACCAMGILRLSVWAPANRFYPASVNPGSAAYAFIEGQNLFQTLCANLPETNPRAYQAPWLSNEQPTSPDAVARLAWRPRKLWLNVGSKNDHCANCGSSGELITTLCNEGGWSPPVTTGQQFGKDVLSEFQKLNGDYKAKKTDKRKLADKVVRVAPVILKCRMKTLSQADFNAEHPPVDESNAARIARVINQLYMAGNQKIIKELTKKPMKEEKPLLDQQDTRVKKFWDEDPHLLKDAESLGLPDLNADAGIQASRFWRDAFRLRGQRQGKVFAIGPVVNKFTFQDATRVSVPNETADQRVERSASIREDLRELVKYTTPNPDRSHPEIHAATVLATPDVETRVQAALISKSDEEVLLSEIYEPVVEQIVASTAKGSPLRRRQAKEHAKALLSKKIKELVGKPGQPSNVGPPVDVPVKPKGSRKKGGLE